MNEPTGGKGQKPLAVYAVLDRKEKAYWMRVGSAFTNRDSSLTVFLDAVPVGTNRLQIREPRAWEDAPRSSNGAAGASLALAEVQP